MSLVNYLPSVTEMRLLEEHKVYLVFNDSTKGVADLSDLVGRGPVFEPLRDYAFFRKMRLNHESGTLEWPNGADVAPESLYDRVRESETHVR